MPTDAPLNPPNTPPPWPPPGQGQVPPARTAAQYRPLSSAAVGGFVCSLIVFIPLLPQLIGFILGLIGVSNTRAGRLRGRGMAVAALVITPLVAIAWVLLIGVFVALMMSIADVAEETQALFTTDAADFSRAVTTLREKAFSERLKMQVDDAALAAFVRQVRESYGPPKGFVYVTTDRDAFGGMNVQLDVKFGDETRRVTLQMALANALRFEIDNIHVGELTLLPRQ